MMNPERYGYKGDLIVCDPKEFPECFPHDARGECDRCHRDGVLLWNDESEPGGWQYCRPCWKKLINRLGAAVFTTI